MSIGSSKSEVAIVDYTLSINDQSPLGRLSVGLDVLDVFVEDERPPQRGGSSDLSVRVLIHPREGNEGVLPAVSPVGGHDLDGHMVLQDVVGYQPGEVPHKRVERCLGNPGDSEMAGVGFKIVLVVNVM